MKYTNHLNIIIAVVGVIVIAQTLTGTFWNSTPEQKYTLELPVVRPKVVNSAPPQSVAPQERSVFTPPVAAPQIPVAPPPATVAPNSQPVAAATPQQAPTTTPRRNRLFTPGPIPLPQTSTSSVQPSGNSPNVVSIQSQPTSGKTSDGPERPLKFQPPFGARDPVRQPVRDPRSPNLPPPSGTDSPKRNPDSDPPAPPVRSSMPEQRP